MAGRLLLIKSSSAGAVLTIVLFKGGTEIARISDVGKRFRIWPVGGFDELRMSTSVDSVVEFIVTDGDIEIQFDDDGQRVNNTDAQAVPVKNPAGGSLTVNTDPAAPLAVNFAGTVSPVLGVVTVDNTNAEAIPIQNQTLTVIDDKAPVTVGLAAVALVSDATLKRLRVRNSHASATVAIGGVGVTLANGAVQLLPGDIWHEIDAPGAAWYAISDTVDTVLQIQGIK